METNNNRAITIIVIAFILIGIGAFYLGKNTQSSQIAATTSSTTTTTPDTPVVTDTLTTSLPATSQPTPVQPKPTSPAVTPSSPVNTTGFHSYSDSTYGFIIKYPAYVTAKNTFTTFHELGTNWRLNAPAGNQGKNVVELSIFNIDQGVYAAGKQTYPLFFTAKVRVGVSQNTKDCYATDAGYSNQKVASITINGTTWKKFSSSDAAMMKYVQSESYRTVHNNMCYVVEQIKNGSNYRDDTMKTNKTDAELTSYYNVGNTIVRTFTFTK